MLRRCFVLSFSTAVLTIVLLSSSSSPASAHGGEGQLDVTSSTREGDDVTISVFLTYVGDGHGVPGASITLVADGATPIPMQAGSEDGDYTATVAAAPGALIRVTSVAPVVTVDVTAPPAAETTTTQATSDGTTSSSPQSTSAPTTTDATETTEVAAAVPTQASGGDDQGGNGLIIAGLVVLVLAAVLPVTIIVLRKPTISPSSDDGDT